jgi:UDP-N-acetylmuramoylalanine--D-glutamate ligase
MDQFKGKKITIMGLGLLGRGVGDAQFLAECGAKLIITDLKTKEQLKESIKKLSKFKDIKYTLGEHRLEDFRNCDMVLKAAGITLDSIYIKEAQKNNIPIEMDVSLFAKCAPEVMIIGVTGTRGKSMTTALIYEILKQNEKFLKRKVFIGGNVRGMATLPLVKKAKAGDILVCELDSWQLQGFGDAKISPHISVFTSFMPDHMNYYGSATLTTSEAMKKYFYDKANIFKYQKKEDVLIVRPGVKKLIPKDIKSKLIVINPKQVKKYSFSMPGEFQRENMACAVEVAKQFDISISKIKIIVKNFEGLEGRLQFLKTYKGIKIYNDNNATTIYATLAGIEALKQKGPKRIILMAGGTDKIKDVDLKPLVAVINKYCKNVLFLQGTGTIRLINNYKIKTPYEIVGNLKELVQKALKHAKRGDIILFSPAFASFGMFKNEYDRGDQFISIVKKLKPTLGRGK